jgi:lipopolysaccharide export system protein LptA
MGNRWQLVLIALFLALVIPWVGANGPKIAIRANRLEHSLTEKITDCYGSQKEPVRVTYGTWQLQGQFARWDEGQGVVIVKGKVELMQKGDPPMTLHCQELRFWPQKEEFEARGSVEITRGELCALAGTATGGQKEAVLTEQPMLTRGEDRIKGQKITILFAPQEKIIVEEAQLEVEAERK